MSSNKISPLTRAIGLQIINSLGLAATAHGSLFERGDYHALVHLAINPAECSRDEYLLSEVFSKFPFDIGVDRKATALKTFVDVENALRSSDVNLKLHLSRPYMDRDFHWVFHSMKEKIRGCLGPFSWDLCEEYFGFGPGASFDVKRSVSQVPNKYGKTKPSVTVGCLDLAKSAVCSHSVWRDFHTSVSGQDPEQWFTIVPGNKVVTVPKNSKTDRTIAIEPTMNMYIQKGLGGMVRQRLRKVGVDLNDQSRNQALAREGSLTGKLVTVDLSSASDSVSWYLVQELLPPDWVTAIELCRSPRGVLPSGLFTYQKVSSMGNGFTFELESLIFWALCTSVVDYLRLSDRTVSVYGDDLVIPNDAFELTKRCLSTIGFTVNLKKTHVTGWFRESCGKHYSHGLDVSPFYIRENVDTPDRLVLLANLCKNWGLTSVRYGVDERMKPVWDLVVQSVPPRYRVFGPLWVSGQLNDRSIGIDFDEARPFVKKAKHFVEGYYYPCLRWRETRRRLDHHGTLICALDDRSGFRKPGEWSSYPKLDHRLAISRSLVPLWQDTGPWLTTTA